MIFLGTIVNSALIIVGGILGVLLTGLFAKSKRLLAIPDVLMRAVGLCVIYIGISGVINHIPVASASFGDFALLIMIGCIAVGTLIGELIDIDKWINRLGKAIETRVSKPRLDENGNEIASEKGIAKGFVSATILFCVGAMAITGSIESGFTMGESQGTLFAKSALDFVSSVVFGATLGIGTILSTISVFIYQGAIELLAIFLGDFLHASVVAEMSATGSLLIFAIGLNMIGVTKIKVANMLPAIFLPLFACIFV